MSYTNGIINKPVSFYDVQQALGESSPDEGTLCKSSKINKWARYKPVPKAGIDIQQVWLHPIGSGFENSIITDTPINIIQNDEYGLNCELPSGSMSSPYRITDFQYYSNNAVCPIAFACDATIEEGTVPGFTLSIDNQINGFSGDYNLHVKDILTTDTFGSYRLTAAIVRFSTVGDWSTATPIRYFYSEETWDSGTGNELVVFCTNWSAMNLQAGTTYGVVMMLTESDYDRRGTIECDNDAIHLQLEDALDRTTFKATSEGSGIISDNNFIVDVADCYWDDTTELPDSIGVYYNTYQISFSEIKITHKNGTTYAGDPFSNYEMRLAINIEYSLDINERSVDTDSSFDERRFYLTNWFSMAIGSGSFFSVDLTQDKKILMISIYDWLLEYIYQEQNTYEKEVTFEIWMRRSGSTRSFLAGGATGYIKNDEEFEVRQGVVTEV